MWLANNDVTVVVDGHRLDAIAPGSGELKITDRWGATGGGCWEMTWTIPTSRLRRHRAFVIEERPRPVRAYLGPWCRWSGYLAQTDWDTGQMVAYGNVRRGEEAVSLDSNGFVTTVADVGIDQAIARGVLPWVRRTSINATAVTASDAPRTLNYVTDVTDAATQAAGVSWGVNPRDEVYTAPPATVPTLLIAPDSGELGTSDAVIARRILGRYQPAGGNGVLVNTAVGSGAPEVAVSLLDHGSITEARAQEILRGILAKLQPRTAWTNGITVTAPQVTSAGSGRMSLALVRADGRNMARLQGVRDVHGLDAGTNFVVGESVWAVADREVQVNPVGMVAHDLGSIIEDAGAVLLPLS